jgi:CRISPR system Cascade subunit CasB
MHAPDAPHISLGAAFRQLSGRLDSGSIEQRFVAVLKSSRERLPDHLRHAIALLRANDVSLDWVMLFSDLVHWQGADGRVAQPVPRRWAHDYWA